MSQNSSRQAVDITTMVYGKVPPQAKELEQAVLGAMMVEKGAIDRIVNILTPEMFYVTAHQMVYEAMLTLNRTNQPIDMHMVIEQLKKMGELEASGGAYGIAKLTDRVVSGAHIEAHARIVCQKFLQRELIRVGGEIVSEAYTDETDVFELLDRSEESLLSIGKKHVHGDVKGIDSVLVKTIQRIEEWRKSETHVTGIPTGFPMLDRATRGWQNTDLIIIAARPSVGKSAFALQLIRNAVFNKLKPVGVAIWSLEMEDVQMVLRMISSESGIALHRIQTGRIDDSEMVNIHRSAIQKLAQSKIFIDDESGLSIQRLKAKARRVVNRHKVGLIIVDYLQLMSGDDKNREREIASISRGLKLLAKELRVPIIALSQLSREIEKRTGSKKIPQLSDLRESGAIEQDADMVIFLWGPDDDEIEQDAALLNRRYARIAKQRNGMLLTVEFEFDKDIQEWSEAGSGPKLIPMNQVTQNPRPVWRPYADDKDEEITF